MIGSDSEITRTAATVAFYRKEGWRLIVQAGTSCVPDASQRIMDTVHWFVAQHHRWKPASIRIFRAALRQLMHDLRQNIHINQRGIADFETALQSGPAPKPRSAEKVGASKKRKSVKKSEIKRLYRHLQEKGTQTSRVLAKWLIVGVHCGWRPFEALRGMSIENEALVIACAKTTNGRGIGDMRKVQIKNDRVRQEVEIFINELNALTSSVDDLSTIYNRFAKALAAAGDACKIRRISLYTLRHQALATAKAMMTPEEVAALAGHGSVNTAAAHYGRRRSGWNVKPAIAVSKAQVALVRGEFREFPRGTVLTPAP
jgi:integrase